MRVPGIALFCALIAPQLASSAERIVCVGGAITEIVYALGAENKLVAVDTTSVYPDAATKLPQVGYQRSLSAEGILAMNPDLVLLTSEAGPPAAIQQLKSTGISMGEIPEKHSIESVRTKIEKVALAIAEKEKGEKLVKQLNEDAKLLENYKQSQPEHPRVMFLMSMGSSLMAAGKDTGADAMITMAGGENVFTDYSRYRPINAEAILSAAPEAIVVPARTAEALGGVDAILQRPELAATPAGQRKQVIVMDEAYLLGFGPRTALAALELSRKLHGD